MQLIDDYAHSYPFVDDDTVSTLRNKVIGHLNHLDQQLLERDALIEKLKNIFELSFGITKRESEAINLLYSKLSPSEALAQHDKALLDEAFERVGFVREYGIDCLQGTLVDSVSGRIPLPSSTQIDPYAVTKSDIPLFYRRKEITK
jgi:hypothetical protein